MPEGVTAAVIGVVAESWSRRDTRRGHAGDGRQADRTRLRGAGRVGGGAGILVQRRGLRRRRRDSIGAKADTWGSQIVLKVNAPSTDEIALLREGRDLGRPDQPGPEPGSGGGAGGATHHRAGHGRGAAHLARPVAWTCCPRWPTSRVTGRWSRPRTCSAGSSPARSPRRARSRRRRCWWSAPESRGWPRSVPPGSMGAIVRATDPRPEVADQVRSLGGEYLSIESPEVEVSATRIREGDGPGLPGPRGRSCMPSSAETST